MTLLDPHDYHKARAPLAEVDFNNLFARSVVEQHVEGAIWYWSATATPSACVRA